MRQSSLGGVSLAVSFGGIGFIFPLFTPIRLGMKKSLFLSYCLLLAFVIVQAHLYVRYKFSGIDELRVRIGHLHGEVEQERFRADLARYQLSEYRQQVAVLIPEALKTQQSEMASFQLRNLASVAFSPNSERLPIERGSGLFEKAKTQFRDGLYEDAAGNFRELIRLYPESVHMPEAYFLLTESFFLTKEYESCVDSAESMITLFPESELTGFALLRLGKIYEYQDRLEDAVEIYRTVLASYTNPPLLTQARLNLKAVEL